MVISFFFQTIRCCNSVENGNIESFNIFIIDVRKRPIITMLEELKICKMERLYRINMKV